VDAVDYQAASGFKQCEIKALATSTRNSSQKSIIVVVWGTKWRECAVLLSLASLNNSGTLNLTRFPAYYPTKMASQCHYRIYFRNTKYFANELS